MPRLFTSPGFASPPAGGYSGGAPSFTSPQPSFTTPSPSGAGFGFSQQQATYSNSRIAHHNLGPLPPSSSTSSSVRLCCSSPDGKAIHSLLVTGGSAGSSPSCYIETHTLPLAGTTMEEASTSNNNFAATTPAIIRTRLPESVSSALSRYPALELLCLGGGADLSTTATNSFSLDSPRGGQFPTTIALPLLGLYTKKDVFVLELSYQPTGGAPEIEGTVVSVDEPYDEFLMTNSSADIIRIQPAPQQGKGYATLCPPGAMAMLTQDRSSKMYSLTLYHGPPPRGTISMESMTSCHQLGIEELDDPMERIVDFCFCQSSKLSLLSSLTVVFLKGNGRILFATPIVFKGTVVASAAVQETIDFLAASIQMEEPYTPARRHYNHAKTYITDVFPTSGRSSFITTAYGSSDELHVVEWGVQIQGPLLSPSSASENYDESQLFAKSIVPFGGAGDLVGLAVGYTNETVDIAVASPTSLVPRFSLESRADADFLDENLPYGMCVDRIELSGGERSAQPICLVPDPIMDNVVHLVTPSHIGSVSSNAAQIASNKAWEESMKKTNPKALQVFSPPSKRGNMKQKTTAWSCLDVSFFQGNQNPIVGAIVSSNVEFGHILVARLRDGTTTAVNLTEKQHLNEMDELDEKQTEPVLALTDGPAASESLAENIQPLIQKIYDGLSNLSQFGGSSTAPEDISVEALAGAMSIYEKSKREVYLPVKEMNERVSAKREELKGEIQRQLAGLQALKEVIGKLREKKESIQEQVEVLYTNSKELEQRSSSALQSCKDLQPTITQAEYDYFQEVKRLADKTKGLESKMEIQNVQVASLFDSIESDTTALPFELPEDRSQNATDLLAESGRILSDSKTRLNTVSRDVDRLAAFSGYISQGHRSTE